MPSTIGGQLFVSCGDGWHGPLAVPVVALDRIKHNDAVAQLKRDGEIASATVAFRAEQGDFEDFEAKQDQIDYDLAAVFEQFESIDLILDCRLCTGMNVSETAQQIAAFAQKFCATSDKIRRVIVTGSSLPASVGDVLSVDSTEVVVRRELAILSKARDFSAVELVAGDYATVSPFYSDADLDPKLMQTVMTPRLIYPFERSYFVTRGISMKSGGQEQYVGLTKALCGQVFFPRSRVFYWRRLFRRQAPAHRQQRHQRHGGETLRRCPHHLHGARRKGLSAPASTE